MEIGTFKDMYIAELQELADVQRQLEESQRHQAEMAANSVLKQLLEGHAEETRAQKERIEAILKQHEAGTDSHRDQAMEALLRETGKMLGLLKDDDLRDAGLIASAQKIAHYEIAAFGTAAALAGQLDLEDDQRILAECCEEERQADARLSELAKREVNPHAVTA